MTTRALRRAAYAPLLLLAGLLALGPGATPVGAAGASLVQYGWWTEANYLNGTNAPTDQAPDAADLHVSIGPLVYDDPYSIQHDNPTGATELSAVMYQLPSAVPVEVDPATPVADLKVTIDQNYPTTGTVVLLACRTLESWSPEKGGNWNDRVYAQQGGCSVGYSSDGSTYRFAILASQLSGGGRTVDMAIVPTLDPHALPFKAWFRPPTAADLTVLPLPVSSADTFSVPQEQAATQDSGATGSGYPASAFASVAAPAPPAAPPGAPPSAGPAPAAPQPSPQLATANARPAALDTTARIVAGVLLLAVLLALMSAVGLDMQRLLTPAGQMGGVGRFRRQRSGPPLPL